MGSRTSIAHSDPARNEVPITSENPLPVSNMDSNIKRLTGTITVAGGVGTLALTNVDMKSNYIGVQAPGNETFEVKITDTDTGVILTEIESRSSDAGNARSKSLGIPLFNITIEITEASGDGDFKYLVMG